MPSLELLLKASLFSQKDLEKRHGFGVQSACLFFLWRQAGTQVSVPSMFFSVLTYPHVGLPCKSGFQRNPKHLRKTTKQPPGGKKKSGISSGNHNESLPMAAQTSRLVFLNLLEHLKVY